MILKTFSIVDESSDEDLSSDEEMASENSNESSDEEMASDNSNEDDEDTGPDPELYYKFQWICAQISSFLDVYISQQ